MKRTVICNIPMKRDIANGVYTSEDSTLPVCEVSVKYPVNAVLRENPFRRGTKCKSFYS